MLRDKIMEAPEKPGVYLFKDEKGRIIYIGKARDLRDRLKSYLSPQPDSKRRSIVNKARDLDFIVTSSEVEALVLEENLIKLNKPKYNVRLKDDKKYPYLKITIRDRFPRIFPTRSLKRDGSILFGPYTSMKSLKRALKGVKKVFKIRTCNKRLPLKKPERPCLEFQMNRCLAPCQGNVDEEEYRRRVKDVIAFLSGKSILLEKEIEEKMWKAAKEENYEKAAILRDQLLSLREIRRQQPGVLDDTISRDVIGIAYTDTLSVCSLFKVREGKLIGKENYPLSFPKGTPEEEVLETLLRNIYTHTFDIPKEILLPLPIEGEVFVRWFLEHRRKRVRVYTPKRGDKLRLIKLASQNALLKLTEILPKERVPFSILELQRILNLDKPPRVIEGIDISNIMGKDATGSIVVFEDGRPTKSKYRRFRIKTVKGPDDYGMIREVLTRRFKRLLKEGRPLPDLLLVDGGKGQLSSALRVLKEIEEDIPVLAFAKRFDQLYFKDGRMVSIPGNSSALKLLKRIRDESHRFAITFHRKLRGKKTKRSVLERIEGIGEKRKLLLLQYFGSLQRLKSASLEEIAQVKGIGKRFAERIYEFLHPDNP